jgi:hypothetical protein
MKTNHTFGIHFKIRATKNERMTGAIFARITVDKNE